MISDYEENVLRQELVSAHSEIRRLEEMVAADKGCPERELPYDRDGMASYVLQHGGWCWNNYNGNMYHIYTISKHGVLLDLADDYINYTDFHKKFKLQKDVRNDNNSST
jgi:hypothetical protein